MFSISTIILYTFLSACIGGFFGVFYEKVCEQFKYHPIPVLTWSIYLAWFITIPVLVGIVIGRFILNLFFSCFDEK